MNLKDLRKSKKMSMDDLASQFGVTRQTIYNYETGQRKASVQVLQQYAEFFGVSIDSIIQDSFSLTDLQPLEVIKPVKAKDEMEEQLLERFRTLSFDDKLKAINYITNLTK